MSISEKTSTPLTLQSLSKSIRWRDWGNNDANSTVVTRQKVTNSIKWEAFCAELEEHFSNCTTICEDKLLQQNVFDVNTCNISKNVQEPRSLDKTNIALLLPLTHEKRFSYADIVKIKQPIIEKKNIENVERRCPRILTKGIPTRGRCPKILTKGVPIHSLKNRCHNKWNNLNTGFPTTTSKTNYLYQCGTSTIKTNYLLKKKQKGKYEFSFSWKYT